VARFASIQEAPGTKQRGREDAVLLGEAREQVHVLGRLLVDHVDHVVDGDHAQHAALRVGHGDRQQVVARDQLSGLLLIGVGADAHGLRDHQLRHAAVGRRRDEAPERDHAAQAPALVDHVEVEDRARLVSGRPDPLDRLLRGELLVQRDESRGHHAARARRRMTLRPLELLALRAGQVPHDLCPPLLRDSRDQLQHVVDLEPPDHVGQALVGERIGDRRQLLGRQLAHHAGGAALAEEQLDHGADLVRGEAREQRCDVGRLHAREQPLGAAAAPLASRRRRMRARCHPAGHHPGGIVVEPSGSATPGVAAARLAVPRRDRVQNACKSPRGSARPKAAEPGRRGRPRRPKARARFAPAGPGALIGCSFREERWPPSRPGSAHALHRGGT
jgi:hypothetical protein